MEGQFLALKLRESHEREIDLRIEENSKTAGVLCLNRLGNHLAAEPRDLSRLELPAELASHSVSQGAVETARKRIRRCSIRCTVSVRCLVLVGRNFL